MHKTKDLLLGPWETLSWLHESCTGAACHPKRPKWGTTKPWFCLGQAMCKSRHETIKPSNHHGYNILVYNITIWSSTLLTLQRYIYSVFTPGIPYPTYPFFGNWLHAGENVAIQCVPYLQVAHLSPLRKQITNKMKTSSKETLGDIKFLWSRDRVTGSPCLHCLRVSLPELHLSQRKLFRWWHTPRKLSTSILTHLK